MFQNISLVLFCNLQFDDYGLFLKIIEWSIHNLVHVVHPGRHALVTLPHAENLFVKEGVGCVDLFAGGGAGARECMKGPLGLRSGKTGEIA